MNDELMQSIIELIRDGGAAAVWIYCLHLGAGILKFIVGFGFFFLAVKSAGKVVLTVAEKK